MTRSQTTGWRMTRLRTTRLRTTRLRIAAVTAAAAFALLAAASSSDSSSSADASDSGDAAASTTIQAPTTTTVAGPAPSAGCGDEAAAAAVTPGTSDHTIHFQGADRPYQVMVPDDYDGTTPLPLIFGLHALSISHTFVAGGAGFAEEQGDYDFIAVMPSDMEDAGGPFWVAPAVADNPDVAYMNKLLDQLEADLCIDTTKVFSTGQSNGAQMSSALACQMSDRITAVAPIAGVEFPGDGRCGDPVPVMAFHGTADPIVTYEGGGLNAETIADQHFWHGDVPDDVPEHDGVDQAMRNWAENNGCDKGRHGERISSEVVKYTWENCDAETILYVVEGGGHTWPGRPFPQFEAQFGHTTTDIDATPLMFDFFLGPPGGDTSG